MGRISASRVIKLKSSRQDKTRQIKTRQDETSTEEHIYKQLWYAFRNGLVDVRRVLPLSARV